MRKKRGHYKPRENCLKAIFRDIADGDVKVVPLAETNVSSLRTRAAELNRDAGYQKFKVSVDSFMGVVRIASL